MAGGQAGVGDLALGRVPIQGLEGVLGVGAKGQVVETALGDHHHRLAFALLNQEGQAVRDECAGRRDLLVGRRRRTVGLDLGGRLLR